MTGPQLTLTGLTPATLARLTTSVHAAVEDEYGLDVAGEQLLAEVANVVGVLDVVAVEQKLVIVAVTFVDEIEDVVAVDDQLRVRQLVPSQQLALVAVDEALQSSHSHREIVNN